jgi:putative nucleotidyltransferase with HDIG domain
VEPLLDLLGALSVATDAAAGFPRETALRTSVIAHRLARAAGLSDAEVRAAGLAGLLRYLGCTGAAHEGARFGAGSDMAFLQAFAGADFGSPVEMLRGATRLGAGAGVAARAAALTAFVRPGTPRLVSASHCEVAERLARAFLAPQGALQALSEMYERHDGRGQPGGLAAGAISKPGQVVSAAQTIEVIARTFGTESALEVARRRRGGQLSPMVVDAFARDWREVLSDLDRDSVWEPFRVAEPEPRALLRPEQVDDIALAFAHFADIKSPHLLGHSVAVAELALAAAPGLGVAVDLVALRRGALLHDLGRVSIENGIWDCPGPLAPPELARARSHSYETERLLLGSPLWRPSPTWSACTNGSTARATTGGSRRPGFSRRPGCSRPATSGAR